MLNYVHFAVHYPRRLLSICLFITPLTVASAIYSMAVITLVNVYVDLVVFTRVAGTS